MVVGFLPVVVVVVVVVVVADERISYGLLWRSYTLLTTISCRCSGSSCNGGGGDYPSTITAIQKFPTWWLYIQLQHHLILDTCKIAHALGRCGDEHTDRHNFKLEIIFSARGKKIKILIRIKSSKTISV
jgi:hypothetical protein